MRAYFWDDKRAPGVPAAIDFDEYSSVAEMFLASCAKYPERPAFWNIGITLTFREVDELSRNFAAWIQHQTNLKPGDRIAVQMPNMLQFPIVVFGALRAGLVVVNTNPLYTAREMRHQFRDSGVKALVALNTFGAKIEEVIEDTDIEHVVITEIGDMQTSGVKRNLLNFAIKHVKRMVPAFNLPQEVGFREVMAQGAREHHEPVTTKPEDLAILQYTGGTTGVAKGAMLSNRNLLANMLQVRALFQQTDRNGNPMQQEANEVLICPLPLYHIFSFTAHCMCMMAMGNLNVLVTNPRDVGMFIKIIKNKKFSGITAVNTLFVALLDHPKFKDIDFSKLKLAVSGGTALTRDAAVRWKKATGVDIAEGYGLTECSPIVSVNPLGELNQMGTIGVPVPGTDTKVIDEDGNELPLGQRGELCVRGPQVMEGYWNRPEETAEVMTDKGYLRTGDVAIINHDGFIQIVDRLKDMILVSGFNVYPNEIEDVVSRLDNVTNCAAIGVPDNKTGEAVKLFVQPNEKGVTVADVKSWCAKNLTAYKRPKYIEIREELPMSPVGKILRKDLREH